MPHLLPALLLGLATAVVPAALAAPRPNILFILADDLGAHDLGCYGSRFHRTPQLDQLAARSMKFTQAYAAAPVCSPTRASILTGQYPARLHLTDWLPGRGDLPAQRLARPTLANQLPASTITLAEAFKQAGYRTGHIGKWHLGGKGFSPQDRGFEVNLGGDNTGTPLSYFAPFRRGDRFMPGLEQAPEGEYLTDRLTAETLKFIEQNHDQPFYLQLWHYAVHTPLRAKDALVARFPVLTGLTGQQTNAIYAAMLESVDEGVGRILRRLEELNLATNTVIVFTSDNGGLCTSEGPHTPATDNGPLREGKGYLYEGGLRVPLLIHWPGVTRAASTCATPVSSIDFFATLTELAGLTTELRTDGTSLVPLLKGDPAPVREALFWHYPHYSNQGGRPGGAIRVGDFKLIEFFENDRRELFNLNQDPGEIRNLAAAQPERVRELTERLQAWRAEVGALPMTANPAYRPHPPNPQGVIELPARTADVHGSMLRFEPLPHKNTLGFWVESSDWVSWEFTVERPGAYTVEVTQGCGNGSGGSEVEFRVGDQALTMTVQETGGFQNFVPRDLGRFTLTQTGRHTLTVRPKTKPGAAVMDLPRIRLKPAP